MAPRESGNAELLAVVLAPPGTGQAELYGALARKVTRWGSDPIWTGPRIDVGVPPRSAFPLRLETGPLPAGTLAPEVLPEEENDLPPGPFRLADLRSPDMAANGPSVSAVAHAVSWDAERELWFADIVVEPGSVYTPHLQCAFARYQPISVTESTGRSTHLSNIVLADFVQLSPDRLATLRRLEVDTVELSLFGILPDAARSLPHAGTIEVRVERRTGDGSDELAWQPFAGVTFEVIELDSIGGLQGSALLAAEDRLGQRFGLSIPANAALRAEAESLVARRDFTALIASSDLFAALSPPEIWRAQIEISPLPARTRLRFVLSELEVYPVDGQTADARSLFDPAPEHRIVFVETFEVDAGGNLPITIGG